MIISTFDLFKIGIGPSSSHTMGPMIAAARFVDELTAAGRLHSTTKVEVKLYASLALTGRGHATDRAVLLGLAGFLPDTIDPDSADGTIDSILAAKALTLGGEHQIAFDARSDIVWAGRERLPPHPNALRFTAFERTGSVLLVRTYYSIGGGFVLAEDEEKGSGPIENAVEVPLPFTTAAQLLRQADEHGLSIAGLMLENELSLRTKEEVEAGLDRIVEAMDDCIDRGLVQHGELPGGLRVKRRAREMQAILDLRERTGEPDPLAAMDRVNSWAIAVNEENAGGGRVVTAPTNGAAGIVPAVLRYFGTFHYATTEQRRNFVLTAAAIGALYKRNASISGAEVGCQGEVGVACSMAAAALAAVFGGSNAQIENAAEIAMEHNLGLTCDPIAGLVQIPCIERNAMGAIKAIDAARMALVGNGDHHVSLDKVIATMKRTGADMKDVYKETSLGGLAVNYPDC